MKDTVDFLKSPATPRGPVVQVRVVLRRSTQTLRELDASCLRGEFTAGNRSVCELSANGSVVSRGIIVERDGVLYFEGGKDEHS